MEKKLRKMQSLRKQRSLKKKAASFTMNKGLQMEVKDWLKRNEDIIDNSCSLSNTSNQDDSSDMDLNSPEMILKRANMFMTQT